MASRLLSVAMFLIIANMFSAAIMALPDNDVDPVNSGNNLFSSSGFGADQAIYNESQEDLSTQTQYDYGTGEDEDTGIIEELWGRFLQLGKGLIHTIDEVLFGTANLIRNALGSPAAGPAYKVIAGIKVVMGLWWVIVVGYFLRGLATE